MPYFLDFLYQPCLPSNTSCNKISVQRVWQDQITATKTGCVTDHLIMWIDHQPWSGIWHLESLRQIKTSADKTKTSMMYHRHTRQQPLPSLDHRNRRTTHTHQYAVLRIGWIDHRGICIATNSNWERSWWRGHRKWERERTFL